MNDRKRCLKLTKGVLQQHVQCIFHNKVVVYMAGHVIKEHSWTSSVTLLEIVLEILAEIDGLSIWEQLSTFYGVWTAFSSTTKLKASYWFCSFFHSLLLRDSLLLSATLFFQSSTLQCDCKTCDRWVQTRLPLRLLSFPSTQSIVWQFFPQDPSITRNCKYNSIQV